MQSVLRFGAILLCIGIMAFCAYKLYTVQAEYAEGTALYDDLANQYAATVETTKTAAPSDAFNEEPQELSGDALPLCVNFDTLLEANNDVVAWIYCADTPINYPVVQSDDNTYYLRRMLNGKYNIAGSLFMDYRCPSDFSGKNSIIYGHNMKNGSMFSILPSYGEQSYYEAHPIWYLLTPSANYKIELIGGYITTADSDTYSLPQTAEDVAALAAKAKQNSTFTADVEITEEDRLITLSTCAKDYGNTRYVLVGVLREADE